MKITYIITSAYYTSQRHTNNQDMINYYNLVFFCFFVFFYICIFLLEIIISILECI